MRSTSDKSILSARAVAWLRLLRPPNLPTVPGDPLVGYVLGAGAAGAARADWVWAVGSALLLYAAGLVLNDVADLAADRRERPKRPLPSGTVTRRAALLVGLSLGGAGVGLAGFAGQAAFVAALVLLGLVLAYDFLLPRGSLAGLVTMGACRATSVVLGLAASGGLRQGSPLPWLAAGGTGAYIVGVSWIAVRENQPQDLRWRRWLPLGVWVVLFGVMLPVTGAGTLSPALPPTALAAAGLALFAIAQVAWRLGPQPPVAAVPRAIGSYIRCLLLVQAACCSLVPGWGHLAGALILCLWPVSTGLARRFYAS